MNDSTTRAFPVTLEVRSATKSFGAVATLASGTIALEAGSIHALIGENGAAVSGGRRAIPGVIAGALLIAASASASASALQLAGITSDVISIITGSLLVLSVVLTGFLTWLHRARQGAVKRRRDPAQPTSVD